MILVDTSLWVEHLRLGSKSLADLLNDGSVLTHPFVIGEVALGVLRNRAVVLEALRNLPMIAVATDDEVMHFVDTNRLSGAGIGWVDAHLLASTRLSNGAKFWTKDKRLAQTSETLGLAPRGPLLSDRR